MKIYRGLGFGCDSFILFLLLSILFLFQFPQRCYSQACTVTGATLYFAADDAAYFYLNGQFIFSCDHPNDNNPSCHGVTTTYVLNATQLGYLNSYPGDNVLAVYGTDKYGDLSGLTWDLRITYAPGLFCPSAQDIMSDGCNTKVHPSSFLSCNLFSYPDSANVPVSGLDSSFLRRG